MNGSFSKSSESVLCFNRRWLLFTGALSWPQFVEDVVNRTHVAQNHAAALLSAELVLKGQKNAWTL